MLKELASIYAIFSARKVTLIWDHSVYFHWVRIRKSIEVSDSNLVALTEKKRS